MLINYKYTAAFHSVASLELTRKGDKGQTIKTVSDKKIKRARHCQQSYAT